MSQPILHLIFVLTFTGVILIRLHSHWQVRRSSGNIEYKEGNLSTLLRGSLGISFVLLLFAYMVYPDLLAWATFNLPEWARWIGASLCVAVLPLLVWVQWALGKNFSTRLHLREHHTLVTHGPYRWVRHPMYTVLLLHAVGLLLLTANLLIGGGYILAIVLVMLLRTSNEEAAMVEKFGDAYRVYMEHTGRFLPRVG